MSLSISILGASAGIGLYCVNVALERGHRVTSLSRSTASLPSHPNLSIVQGSATRVEDLRRGVAGADAIVVALGTGMDRKPTTLYTDFGRALLALQPELGNTPVQIVTGFGAGDSAHYQGWIARLLFRLLLKAVYDNKSELEAMIEASTLNWSLVRPGMLTNKPSSRAAHAQLDYWPGMKVGLASQEGVARFLIEQAEQPTCLHRKPAVSDT
jgi:putative NADH-flavin reductase